MGRRFLSSSFEFIIGKYLENAVYIQVAYLLSDNLVIEREFGNLDLINDNFEKIVISLDDINFGNRDGIINKRLGVYEGLDLKHIDLGYNNEKI